MTHTAKKSHFLYELRKCFWSGCSERCVDYFSFLDDSNLNQMLEVMIATKQ